MSALAEYMRAELGHPLVLRVKETYAELSQGLDNLSVVQRGFIVGLLIGLLQQMARHDAEVAKLLNTHYTEWP